MALAALVASGQQNDQFVPVAAIVDAVARSVMHPTFDYSGTDAFRVGQIAMLHLDNRGADFRGRAGIQRFEPDAEGATAIRIQIFPNFDQVRW